MTRSWGSIKFHAKANTKTRNILTGQGQIKQEAETGGGVGRAVPHNSASIFAYAFIFGFSLSHAIDPWRPQNLPSFSFSLLLLTLLSLSLYYSVFTSAHSFALPPALECKKQIRGQQRQVSACHQMGALWQGRHSISGGEERGPRMLPSELRQLVTNSRQLKNQFT